MPAPSCRRAWYEIRREIVTDSLRSIKDKPCRGFRSIGHGQYRSERAVFGFSPCIVHRLSNRALKTNKGEHESKSNVMNRSYKIQDCFPMQMWYARVVERALPLQSILSKGQCIIRSIHQRSRVLGQRRVVTEQSLRWPRRPRMDR